MPGRKFRHFLVCLGMGTIKNLANRFKALDWYAVKEQSLIETAPQAIPEHTEQQMRLGQRSDGEMIGYLENSHYAMQKKLAGGLAPQGEVDLRNSGSFQAGLRTVVTPQLNLKTYSLDTKAEKLELKYTPLIYGANPKNLSKYATQDLQPVLMAKLKAATVG